MRCPSTPLFSAATFPWMRVITARLNMTSSAASFSRRVWSDALPLVDFHGRTVRAVFSCGDDPSVFRGACGRVPRMAASSQPHSMDDDAFRPSRHRDVFLQAEAL